MILFFHIPIDIARGFQLPSQIQKTLLIVLLFLTSSALSGVAFSDELSDLDPVLSANDVTIFLRAAECVSIRSANQQKLGFVKAYRYWASVGPSEDWLFDDAKLEEHESLWLDDVDNLHRTLKALCPSTARTISSILLREDEETQSLMLGVLEDLVISLSAVNVINKNDRTRIFDSKYRAIGIEESPF